MRIIGCDLHAAQQTVVMLDRETGEVSDKTLTHDGEAVRAFFDEEFKKREGDFLRRGGRFLIYRGVFANFERGYSLVAVCVIQLSTSLQRGRVASASNPLRLSPIFNSNPPSHRTEMLKLISLS